KFGGLNMKAFMGDTDHPIGEKEGGIHLNETMIPPGQLKHLCILTGDLKEEDLRKILKERYGVDSRKNLTRTQADAWIIELGDEKRVSETVTKPVTKNVGQKKATGGVSGEQVVELLEDAEEEIIVEMDADIHSDLPLAFYMEWTDKRTKKKVERVTLSAVAWFEAARNLGLVTESIEFIKVDGKLAAVARVKDPATNAVAMGFASRLSDPNTKLAIELLSVKANRNAIKKLVPVEARLKLLEKAKKLNLVKELPYFEFR
ncbi:hypothetical protein LCGC14_2307750, partial [marine sediment metagenome]